MKQLILITAISAVSFQGFGQGQIANSDMENWGNVGSATEEPTNWSGIKTASGNGTLIAFAPQAVTRSTDTPSGSGFSARLVANSVFSTIANGTLTCGRLNVGSATAADPSNYSWSDQTDDLFSEALTDMPDSIVWWAKYTAADTNHLARMKATLHDDYDYRDPEDATSSMHVVATAIENYASTGDWQRHAVAFDYSGPVSVNTFILVTFTTNQTPGVGTDGDEVLIDDVQLVYSDAKVNAMMANDLQVSMDNTSNTLILKSDKTLSGNYQICNSLGQLVKSGALQNEIPFDATEGTYFLRVEGTSSSFQFIKL